MAASSGRLSLGTEVLLLTALYPQFTNIVYQNKMWQQLLTGNINHLVT